MPRRVPGEAPAGHQGTVADRFGVTAARLDVLHACALEANRIAQGLCWTDPATGESCAWYHGFWPTLRTLGIVTTPDTHRAFYARTFADLIGQSHRRVLISGSTDINMLEQVFTAFEAAEESPHITFVDRCPTPVALARWYAERTGRAITAIASTFSTSSPDHST